jgi:hypothetical protein
MRRWPRPPLPHRQLKCPCDAPACRPCPPQPLQHSDTRVKELHISPMVPWAGCAGMAVAAEVDALACVSRSALCTPSRVW